MNKPQKKERRGKGRMRVTLPVQVQLPDGQVLGLKTANLSDSGAFLCCTPGQQPPMGTEVLIWLEALPFDPPEVRGRVVHHFDQGFGVAFILDDDE